MEALEGYGCLPAAICHALVHDVVTTIGLFALLQLEFNLATVAAILTIAGYSINDTVIVFDRIREYGRLAEDAVGSPYTNETIDRLITEFCILLWIKHF